MDELRDLLSQAVKDVTDQSVEVDLDIPDEKFGDYATSIALKLSKSLGQNPREIAEKIVHQLKQNDSISDASVAGPGFVNIWLTDEKLLQICQQEISKTMTGKVVVAEYSDPNPFKALHAGHLYTTLVGDSIAALLEYAGAKVHRLNYGGDVGLHAAKAMWGIINNLGGEEPQKLQDVPQADRAQWLSQRYVEGNTAYETEEKSKQEIIEVNKRIYKLHADNDHDSNFAKIYWAARQWSYDGFDALYEKLGIDKFEKYVPESEVTPLGLELVQEGLNKGVFEKSDGAIVFKGEDFDLHTRVFITSEGLPTYEAKELGLAVKKWQDYKFDESFVITANDIEQYMQVVLKALHGLLPEAANRIRHLTHGVVKLPGGVKMSSRKGNVLMASDILEAAESASKQAGYEQNSDSVLAAVKYAFVKQRIGGNIIYDPSESVNLHGNSGPYLQYAHARAMSILNKATQKPLNPDKLEASERSLVRKLAEYQTVIQRSINELMPHHLANYLYELAQTFNSFYENNRVNGDPREGQRLWLVKSYADTLRDGLGILNITAPEKM